MPSCLLFDRVCRCTTLSYRSPEMTDLYLDGGEHVIGRKSDIWALGVLMYNLCFFTLPFGESVLSIMSGNVTVPDCHGYSIDLMKLIKYCLTANPKERPNIYQLSAILFPLLLSETNPIMNTENSLEPCIDELVLPLSESMAKSTVHSSRPRKDRGNMVEIFAKPVSTSIKPRDRPKVGDRSVVTTPRATHMNSTSATDLASKQSPPVTGTTDEWSMNQSSMSVLTHTLDSCAIKSPQTDDLIDFNCAVHHKINQLSNVSKSQSLGKQFSSAGDGQHWNMHQLISQSYHNVPCGPQQLYCNTPPNIQTMYVNSSLAQQGAFPPSYAINHHNFCPINPTNSYSYNMNMGHRRLVSEPMGVVSSSIPKIGQQTHSMSSSHGILQPLKVALPIKPASVLNEFDPLTD